MCSKDICVQVSIVTLHQHRINITIDTWSTSQLILSQHSVDTWSIVGHVDWLMYLSTLDGMSAKINWLLINCWPRCWLSVNHVSTKALIQSSIEGWLMVDQGYWLILDHRCLIKYTYDPIWFLSFMMT